MYILCKKLFLLLIYTKNNILSNLMILLVNYIDKSISLYSQ